MTETKYAPVPRFVEDSHKGCKGHGNHMLDCDYTKQEDRDLLVSILDDRIAQYEKDIATSEKRAGIGA